MQNVIFYEIIPTLCNNSFNVVKYNNSKYSFHDVDRSLINFVKN